jgi:hypothetical protein
MQLTNRTPRRSTLVIAAAAMMAILIGANPAFGIEPDFPTGPFGSSCPFHLAP